VSTKPILWQAWDAHEARLLSKADVLNAEQFDTLHYTAANGTDLTIGMPQNHIWESAGSVNAQNEKFIANMPTEEVFSAPDFRRIDGVVKSTKPLSYAGNIIDGMTFRFENGQVTEVTAEKGEETIRRLVEENDGGRSLGEVALVPDPSPISQSGIVFFNTLFDENASNHLALGSAYASSVVGGTEMTQEKLAAAGLNRSTTHVDFMIGSADMNIDGIRKDGSVMPIFRNGDWAF
jgi:aminopeptidase